jgi:hypothetical protein
MRALSCILPIVLVGCCDIGSFTTHTATQREILKKSQAEIARREPWADTATIIIKNPDDFSRMVWKVKAGAFDYSDYPSYKGIYFVEGTERELRFTTDGCLTRYAAPRSACGPVDISTGETMFPAK